VVQHDRLGQMTGNSHACFDLFIYVILVDTRIGIRNGMVIRVKVAMVILDLDRRSNSLRTEGSFIPSGAPGDDLWLQAERIGIDNIHQHLHKIYRLAPIPELHHTIII
jgi:hypothetical protein